MLVERKIDPEPENKDAKEEQDFNYEKYYADLGFDPKKEVIKERRIADFFKQRYQAESEELAENNLREFLESQNQEFSYIPPKSTFGYRESKDYIQNKPKSKQEEKKEPIDLQMALLDAEIKQQIEDEIRIEHQKNLSEQKTENIQDKSPKSNRNMKLLTHKNSGFNENSPSLINEKSLKKLENTFRYIRNKKYSKSQPRGRTQQIINEILDQGRLEFMYSYKNNLKQDSSKKAYAKSVTARVLYANGGRTMYPRIQPFDPKNMQIDTKIQKAKINSENNSILPEIELKNQKEYLMRKADFKGEFSLCKEYRRMKSSGSVGTEFRRIHKENSKNEQEFKYAKNIGGTVNTHLSMHPLRYQYDNHEEDRKKNTLGQLLETGKNAKNDKFLSSVQSNDLNMKMVWHNKQ